MTGAENKTVVILGGSYAGLHVAHYVLKNHKTAKVILVSKVSPRRRPHTQKSRV